MKSSRTQNDIAPPLPQDIWAERSVIGAVLLDNKYLPVAAELLTSAAFFHDHHKRIWKRILDMHARNIPIDLLSLTTDLTRVGDLDAAGGAGYVSALVDGVPRVSNVAHYAGIVREKSLLRRLTHFGNDIQEKALKAEETPGVLLEHANTALTELAHVIQPQTHGSLFDTYDEFEQAADATFSIEGFLQDYAVTAIAALSGDCKTWISLNIAHALLFGPGKLWELFEVRERAKKIVYLIPEVSRSTLKPRLIATKLYDEVDKRLFIRTLTKGPALPLTVPNILREVEGAHVVCDTAIRFMKAVDENSASEAAAALSDDCFTLLRAGALTVIPLFHAPKAFVNQSIMSKEAMIRGSGEFGASIATAWGLRKIDPATTTVHIENIKDRDFQACQPFQLVGRPYLDQEGEFRLHARNCGKLAEYLDMPSRNKGGAPPEAREAKAANLELLRQWLTADPLCSSKQLAQRFRDIGIKVDDSSIRRYRKELSL
jgi:hypothetical protein